MSRLLGLTIASSKLWAICADWSSGTLPSLPLDEYLVVQGPDWAPHSAPLQVNGAVKCLGVHNDLGLTVQIQLELSTEELRQLPQDPPLLAHESSCLQMTHPVTQ